MIDVFSKFAVVVPIKEKKPDDVMAAIFKGFELMGKQPEILYTDEEGAFRGRRGIRTGGHPTHHSWNCLLRRAV